MPSQRTPVAEAIKKARDALHVAAFSLRHRELGGVINEVRAKRLTYLAPRALVDLATAALDADRRDLEGAIVEAGTALGGSAIVLAHSKARDRPLWIFDAFGLIPPPSEKDGSDIHARYEAIVSGRSGGIGDGDLYYGYREDLLADVKQSFANFGLEPNAETIAFVKGHYDETMSIDFPVALAHVDCDWYDSVMVCLRAIDEHLVPGGKFVVDDYGSWSGCTRAVDEFFAGRDDYRFVRKDRLHIVKRAQEA